MTVSLKLVQKKQPFLPLGPEALLASPIGALGQELSRSVMELTSSPRVTAVKKMLN